MMLMSVVCVCVCVCVSLETHDVNVSDEWVDNTRCFSESVGEFLSSHGQMNEPTNCHIFSSSH